MYTGESVIWFILESQSKEYSAITLYFSRKPTVQKPC